LSDFYTGKKSFFSKDYLWNLSVGSTKRLRTKNEAITSATWKLKKFNVSIIQDIQKLSKGKTVVMQETWNM